jgi:hypothetical protein
VEIEMRYGLAALLLAVFPALLNGQTSATQREPLPSIGLPLPPIGLPLPAMGLPPPAEPPPSNPHIAPRPPRPRFRHQPAIVFFGAPYAWGVDQSMQYARPGMTAPSTPPAAPAEPTTGLVYLQIEPSDAQVFVDGEYVGTVSDLNRELNLTPGSRRLEFRATGYEAQAVDARIVAGRSISYRAELTPLARPAAPPDTAKDKPEPASSGTTFYLIPGCYMGNIAPEKVKLPAGCDLSKVVTYRP